MPNGCQIWSQGLLRDPIVIAKVKGLAGVTGGYLEVKFALGMPNWCQIWSQGLLKDPWVIDKVKGLARVTGGYLEVKFVKECPMGAIFGHKDR